MRKIVNQIGGVLILAAMVFVIYPFVVGGDDMESFCSSIELGEIKEDFVERALDAGYDLEKSSDGMSLLIVDTRAMGRFICEVSISRNQITKTEYVFND